MLTLVALIWGATFPLMSLALHYIHPFLFVAARFGIATLIFLAWISPRLKKTSWPLLKAGLILGALNSSVYLLQTYGLRDINPDTAAFTTAVGVIFVPFLSSAFGLAKVKKIEIFGSLLCVFGLYILTGSESEHFNLSEVYILCATFVWAMGVCYLQKITPSIKETELLAFYQIAFTCPAALIMGSLHYQSLPALPPILVFTLLYTAIFATIVVFLIQTRFQKETTATHAAIIYSLEPVLATIIAVWLNKLDITPRIMIGGGIILGSIFMIELGQPLVKKVSRLF